MLKSSAKLPKTKQCNKCAKRKQLTVRYFVKHVSCKFGFNPTCKECLQKMANNRYANNKTQFKLKQRLQGPRRRTRYARIKYDILSYYSNGTPSCKCCGELRLEFLVLDHENGGGNKHRCEISNGRKTPGESAGGDIMYQWVRQNDFPDGFRVLCQDCNFAIGIFGYCPHQNKDRATKYLKNIIEFRFNPMRAYPPKVIAVLDKIR